MLEIVMNFLLCSFRFGSPAAESARARAGGVMRLGLFIDKGSELLMD